MFLQPGKVYTTSKGKTKKLADKLNTPKYRVLQRLSEKIGDTFYIYDGKAFENNYLELQGAFRRIYKTTAIAYSYKTNYTPAICARVNRMGGYAEIVSGMEYEIVKQLGIPGDRVIFNGPCKDEGTIAGVLLSGGIVNLDSIADLNIVQGVARGHPEKRLRVGIRCNLRDGRLPFSRFGLDTEGEEFRYSIRVLRSLKNVGLAGLHCHYPDRNIESVRAKTDALLRLCKSVFSEPPEFLNIGGGFAGKMPASLKAQFRFTVPTYREYAEAAARQVAKCCAAWGGRSPQLFIEPGTAIVADCFSFVTRIKVVKKVNGVDVAVCGGSVFNTSPTAKNIALPLRIVAPQRRPDRKDARTHIAGYTCIESDYLAKDIRKRLTVGDFAIFANVGSYSIVMKPPFILPNVPVIELMGGGAKHRMVKRAESSSMLFASFPGFGSKIEI
jgi:diaminopimelate decarboxylase